MNRHTYLVTLTLEGPILTKSSSPTNFGVDAAFARVAAGPERGKPFIPATHIKGKLLEALLRSGFPLNVVENLFGAASPEETKNEAHRGKLRFSPFIAKTAGKKELLTRIQVDDTTGSVKEGALIVEEMPFAYGEKVIFNGHISTVEEIIDLEKILYRAFHMLTHIGSNRGIGYGKYLGVKIEKESHPLAADSIPDGDILLPLTLQPHGPLCISRHKTGEGNLFESDDFIPGNMIAGAIMETAISLGISPILKPIFDTLTFRQALPCREASDRPQVRPFTIIRHEKKTFDCYLQNKLPAHADVAPAFALDWKDADYEAASVNYPSAKPFRELIVRTAIDSVKLTANRGENNREGKLFAWEVIHPYDSKNHPLIWRSAIHIPKSVTAEQRAALAECLAHLSFLSKTKADCHVTLGKAVEKPTASQLTHGGTVTICLQSPALLADPMRQENKSGCISAKEMHRLYSSIFANILPGLTLSHFYARQKMAGGEFLSQRFSCKHNGSYYPYILTEGGSVFTFTVDDAGKAKTSLDQALLTGLPLPAHHATDTWQTNPYIPRNGFGEILIHQPLFPTYPPMP